MLGVFFSTCGKDQDVINEDNYKLVQFLHEYRIHQIYEVCRSIGQTKRHNKILIQPISGGESGLRHILRSNFYLMITRSQINFGEYLCLRQLIK